LRSGVLFFFFWTHFDLQSDGPRVLLFDSAGAPINVVLQKPDFTAADFVTVSGAGGFPTP
jgi:hypothetical protein